MKIKLTAHIHYRKHSWEKEGSYQILYIALPDDESLTYICAQEVEVEVPDNYDPRAQQITALEKKKQEVMAHYQKTVTDINERISKLQALEYTA
jgi:hypothetical protein